MTAASGGSGEKQPDEGEQQVSGGHEAPPIEDMPAYGDWPAPPPPPTAPPGYGSVPGSYPPPPGYPPGYAAGYPGPGYPPLPEYGVPYPGYPGYPGEYAGGRPGLNALSVVSLVASVLWVCGLGSVAGVVLGAVALNQIKRSGERGYGLAVAGIVVGVLGIVASLVSITFSPAMS